MNDIINEDVIEKVVIKSVAIYKAMSVLPAPLFEDKFKKETIICQQNEIIQSPNLEKCLNEIEPSKENEITDTTNEIKKNLEKKSWKDITNPKLRQKAYNKAWRESNKDKIKVQIKDWREVNKDKIRLQKKAYRDLNKERQKAYDKTYIEANRDKIKAYKEANRDKINNYFKNKKKTDIQFKLSCNLRVRLNSAINNNYKAGSAVKDLGCSIEEFKSYLESKFQSGMSWDNWTTDGWHIDHIKPLASFDLTDRNQLLEACHYTNLQPLWAKDNIIKSDKIINV
jgi:hypothetical protein